MNANGSVRTNAGATVPGLGWIAASLLAAGAVLLLIALALAIVASVRESREPTRDV